MDSKVSKHYDTEYSSLNGFGKKMLERYGWESGHGLGRQRSGRSDIIRVKRRRENQGIGTEKKFQNYWWEKMYDNVLSASGTSNDDDDDSSDSESDDGKSGSNSTHIVTPFASSATSAASQPPIRIDRLTKFSGMTAKYQFSTFVPASEASQLQFQQSLEIAERPTIVKAYRQRKEASGGESEPKEELKNSDNVHEDDALETDKSIYFKSFIDDSLFEACGGRTLKKYRQDGKHKRLQKAEEEALAKWRQKNAGTVKSAAAAAAAAVVADDEKEKKNPGEKHFAKEKDKKKEKKKNMKDKKIRGDEENKRSKKGNKDKKNKKDKDISEESKKNKKKRKRDGNDDHTEPMAKKKKSKKDKEKKEKKKARKRAKEIDRRV